MHRIPTPPPPRPGRRVTLHDVAQYCGVSICTVNKALGNKGALRPETRQAVQEAARQLGYRPNRIAQTLGAPSHHAGRDLSPRLLAQLLRSAAGRRAARRRGDGGPPRPRDFRPVASPRSPAAYQRAILQLLDEKVDGLVLCPGPVDPPVAVWDHIAESKYPLALLGNDIAAAGRLTCVTNDSALRLFGGRAAGEARPGPAGGGDRRQHGVGGPRGQGPRLRGGSGGAGLAAGRRLSIARRPRADVPLERPPHGRAPDLGGLYIGTDNGARSAAACGRADWAERWPWRPP